MSSPADKFDSLLGGFYRAWFRFHPETAVDLGIPGFEDRLKPYDDDEIGALTALQEKLLSSLQEINVTDLDPERQIDYRLMAGQAVIEHHELLEQDWRRRDPAQYLPVNAIYQLTVRKPGDPAAALQQRLSLIPEYLRGARSHLQQLPELIPALWLESACIEAVEGARYLRGLSSVPGVPQSLLQHENFHNLIESAAHSLEDYARFLERDLAAEAQGDIACGLEHFERLLQQRHFLDIDANSLRRFGETLFATTANALETLVKYHWPGHSVKQIADRLCTNHPGPANLLTNYREQMQAARDFLAAGDLVSLPGPEKLEVVETPPFLQHQIPFAAYMEPVPGDPEQQGLYYVTPAETPELLGEHNHTAIKHTCVHEAWPGHHLQFVTANLSETARSFPRLVNASATMYEGWALYCEQMMLEQGFMSGPEHEFVLLRDRLWRALRVVLDVGLHCEGLGVHHAADRMVEDLGFPREQAISDITWYTRAPTVPMGYATGWALINQTRNRQSSRPDFELRTFHDRLLASGSMALGLAITRNFGLDCWQEARAGIFGEQM